MLNINDLGANTVGRIEGFRDGGIEGIAARCGQSIDLEGGRALEATEKVVGPVPLSPGKASGHDDAGRPCQPRYEEKMGKADTKYANIRPNGLFSIRLDWN